MDWINIKGGINWTEGELAELLQLFFDIQNACTQPATRQNFHRSYQLCYKLFKRFPLPLIEVTEQGIIRTRRNFDKEIFSHQYEISYKKQCPTLIKLGRFNRPLESIFYGSLPTISDQSAFLITAAAECSKSVFDDTCNEPEFIFTSGLWEVKPFMAICLGFDPKHLSVNERMQRNILGFRNSVINNCNRLSSEFILSCLSFFSNISSEECKDEKNYIVLTALFCAIRTIYEEENIQVEGVIYPSATTHSKGLCIALLPETVDNNLRLKHIAMFKFERYKTDRKQFDVYPITDLVTPENRIFKFPDFFDKRGTKQLINFQFKL